MTDERSSLRRLRDDHPVFFWGMTALALLLLILTTVVAIRIPQYAEQMEMMDEQLDETERATRDRILESQTRRAELALALLQREMRLKALQEKSIHLAIDTDESTLSLRHGAATLREIPLQIGRDSVINAPDGRSWRFVRGLGERHVADKELNPTVVIPEWVYIGSGRAAPPEAERTIEGGNGRYVIELDDGSQIYSRPEEGPLATAPKPGSFMADEEELRTIFEALGADTPVYIY